jgi:hypothetical protein
MWSMVEQRVAFFLVEMLGGSARPGVAMFQALSGTAAQHNVLKAVADIALDDVGRAKFQALLIDYKGRAKERAKVIHAVWGVSDDYPDALIRMDDAEPVRQMAVWKEAFEKGRRLEKGEYSPVAGKHMLYTERDFLDIEARIISLVERFHDIHMHAAQRARTYPTPKIGVQPAP